MRSKVFSALELGKRLRELRLRAQLTQDETADRMGLTGEQRRKAVERLEHGRIGNPSVDTIGRFLRACGAFWGEIAGVLEGCEPVEIDTKPIKDSEFDVRDKQRLEWAVERQVRKFETKLAAPIGGKPLHPGKQAETVRKLRNYRMVANIIEQAVAELLSKRPLPTIEYPRFKMIAREALGLLWREVRASQKSKVKGQDAGSKGVREQGSEKRRQKAEVRGQNGEEGDFKVQTAKCKVQIDGLADKLAEKVEYWEMQKVDKELVREVQQLVVRRFAALQDTNPELF